MNRGRGNLPGFQGCGWAHNWSVIDRVTIFINNEEVERRNYNNDSEARVQWIEERAEEADIDKPEPLKWARKRIDMNWPNNNENFEALLTEAKQDIIKYSMEKNASVLQHGAKFKDSKRSASPKTAIIDEELEKIIVDLGPKATYKDIIYEIERLANQKDFHPVWQEVKWREEKIDYKLPDKNSTERSLTFGRLKDRLTPLKKIIYSQS